MRFRVILAAAFFSLVMVALILIAAPGVAPFVYNRF